MGYKKGEEERRVVEEEAQAKQCWRTRAAMVTVRKTYVCLPSI
jgi:hypothetical protein